MEGVIGYTTLFAGNFPPKNWTFCAGQIMAIASNTALFSILGTTYGGNGQTTFGLPDLRGRMVVGAGQGPGLSPYSLGEVTGAETHNLLITEMPAHVHPVTGTFVPQAATTASQPEPTNGVAANTTDSFYSQTNDSQMAPFNANLTLSQTGSSLPFSLWQPYLALNYIICLQGVYPARN